MMPSTVRQSRWIPWAFVAFFGVVFLVNGVMVYFAVTTFAGVERRDAYKRAQSYNEVLSEARAQAALGWQARVSVEPVAADAVGRLRVQVLDAAASPLHDADVRAVLKRPTNAYLDFETWLVPTGGGAYVAEIDWPADGVWDALVTVERAGDRYQVEERLLVR
jgi:nitrogen fixation protein FixH